MKRILWTGRGLIEDAKVVDAYYREMPGLSIPPGPPKAGWKRESGFVELSLEKFPGSTPVWIWEE